MGLLRKRGYKGTTFMDSLAITEFKLLIFNISFLGNYQSSILKKFPDRYVLNMILNYMILS